MNRQLLVDDEGDLVYHIVVSRNRRDGRPAPGLSPMDSEWLTSDGATPRTKELPDKYEWKFERTSEFNRETHSNFNRIRRECSPLISECSEKVLPIETQRINLFYCVADWLAIHYHRRVMWAFRLTHIVALIIGTAFILYSNLWASDLLISIFFAGFVLAFMISGIAARRNRHSKYLEYRTLAEGLRVQF